MKLYKVLYNRGIAIIAAKHVSGLLCIIRSNSTLRNVFYQNGQLMSDKEILEHVKESADYTVEGPKEGILVNFVCRFYDEGSYFNETDVNTEYYPLKD